MYGDKEESTMSVFTGQKNIFAEAKVRFRNERDVEKHKQNLLMAMEIAVEADGDYTNAVKQIEKLERGLSKNPSVAAALKFYAEDVAFPEDIQKELEEKGLWANIHAKRKRGERMRKKGEKGAPTPAQMAKAKAASEDNHTPLDRIKADHKREREADAIRRDRELDRARLATARQMNTEKTPDTSDAMKRYKAGKAGFTDIAHLKAKGLIKRSDGTKRKSDKYK